MARYRQTFVVEGTGTFPYDMLRYDHCWPALEIESTLLDSNQLFRDENWFKTPRRIKLARETESKVNLPTVARWQSFGWKVDLETLEILRIK